MDLRDLREEIDRLDEQLVRLFAKRMEISKNIAECKWSDGLAVRDARREEEKLQSVCRSLPPELRACGEKLYELLFQLSRDYQNELIRSRLTEGQQPENRSGDER